MSIWNAKTLLAASVRGGGALPTLLEICDELHSSNTGAGDRLPDGEEYAALDALRRRLRNWREHHAFAEYDAAVRALCEATVRETEWRQAERAAYAQEKPPHA